MDESDFHKISENLSPDRPIRTGELLRGRIDQLQNLDRELRYFHSTAFIYGERGVGKTSLARTTAQLVNTAEFEHVYVACAPGSRILNIFREIAEQLLTIALRHDYYDDIKKRVDIEISLTPALRASFEKMTPELSPFEDANAAIRVIKNLDQLFAQSVSVVIVLDELE